MSGFKVKYSQLFNLSVEQLFYENKLYRKSKTDPSLDLLIVPTAECVETMKRLNLVFKTATTQGGFVVLAHTVVNSGGDTVLRFPIKKGDKLSFWIILRNPDVLSFNSLPVQGGSSKIYYFSNQVTDAGAPRNDLHISVAASGVDGANDMMKTSFSDYHFHHTSPVTAGTEFVRHELTGIQIPAKTIVNQSGQADLYFDLSTLPSGRCKLLISAAEKDSFYYIGQPAQQSFGVIEISLSSLLTANYRTVETGDVLLPGRPFYTILFNNRKTLWRYTITLEKNNPIYTAMLGMTPADRTNFINHFKIVTNDSAITFTQASANDTVFEFVSDNVIALREKYISSSLTNKGLCLTLKKNEGIAGEAIVKDYLPFPSTGVIDALNDPTIYSDIFLTI